MDGRQRRAGLHYPRSAGEFQSWFGTDADCLDYLDWLRWPDGFVCPQCGHAGGWAVADGRYKCAACGGRTSVTAGTLFDRRRTPLTVWFTACWMFASQKDGVSALSLQRSLEIGSYPTAWAMLHRLRSVLVRPGRDRLTGTVEVDETYIGGEEPGLRGGRAKGKKSLVGVAVELRQPRGYGRCRMVILRDGFRRLAAPLRHRTRRAGRRRSSPTLGGATAASASSATPTNRVASGPRAPAGKTPASCCPASTASRPWPSAGCWGPTRVRSTRRTCRATSTSSCSASTGADPGAGGWSSTVCSNSPSRTIQCATATWSSTRSRRRRHPCRPG